jgi:hypothetical protein
MFFFNLKLKIMTAISALISRHWLAVASDSLLTEFLLDKNQVIHSEFRKSKIVPIRNFKAAAAYWGLAKIGTWRTYDFLKEKATNSNNFNSFEEFANDLKNKLNEKLNSINFANPLHRGIGIHLVGYEKIGNQEFPELFLISNFTDPSYTSVGDLAISRNLYGTLPDELKAPNLSLAEQRARIIQFLDDIGLFIFNNGDPMLFIQAANAIHGMFKVALERRTIKDGEKIIMKLASKPIETIKEMQKDFLKKEYIRVGGKIHHLLITERGDFKSDTGDSNF